MDSKIDISDIPITSLGAIDSDHYTLLYEPRQEFADYLVKQRKLPHYDFEESFSHSITSLSGCIRKRWLEWNKFPSCEIPNSKSNFEGIMAMGGLVERDAIELLKRAGIYRGEQVRVKLSQPNISGMVDCIVEWDGVWYVVEIKSCNSGSFYDVYNWLCPNCQSKRLWNTKSCRTCSMEIKAEKKLQRQAYQSKPSFQHVCQVQMYLHIMRDRGVTLADGVLQVINTGLLIYYQKDSSEMSSHRIDYDEKLVAWMLSQLELLEGYIAKEETPPKQYNFAYDEERDEIKGDWQCRYCNQWQNCLDVEGKE
jgi:hypothetical protein